MTRSALLLALACGACGSTGAAGPADARADARDDAGEDASADDASTDDATSADASDAGGATWCDTRAPKPAFCDDFDRGDLGATWDFFQQDPPGAAVHDDATFVSAPASFGVATRKLTGPDFGTILLRKTINGTYTHAHLAFDLYADSPQATGTLAVATLDLATDHLLTLYFRDDDPNTPAATLTEQPPAGAPAARHTFTALPQPGAWTHVDIDADGTAGTLSLAFAGAPVVTAALAKGPFDAPTIRVGVLVSGPAAPYTMRFDDVALDLAP